MRRTRSLAAALRARLLSVPLDLRGKLLIANIAIVVLGLVAMGYYVYFRAQQANAFLAAQLDETVQMEAEVNLDGLVSNHAAGLDAAFESVEHNLQQLGVTAAALVGNSAAAGSWDPTQSLFRLPSGSWDNGNHEAGAVFLPARLGLSPDLTAQLSSLKQLDMIAPMLLETNPNAVAVYYGGRSGEALYYPNIDFATMVPADFDVRQQPWFTQATPEENPEREVAWTDPYLDPTLHGLIVTGSIPVYDGAGQWQGVAAMDVPLVRLTDTLQAVRVGQTGSAFVLDGDGRLIAAPRGGPQVLGLPADFAASEETVGEPILNRVSLDVFDALVQMTRGQSGLETVTVDGIDYFIAYRPLPTVGYSLGLIVPAEEMLTTSVFARQRISQLVTESFVQSTLILLAVLAISLVATLLIGRGLTSPLATLTRTAQKVTAGDLEATAAIETRDEVGILASTLNAMTASLRNLIGSLEVRVAERTAQLEAATKLSEKRASEMRAVAEISSLITSEQELDALLPMTTELVSDRFGFYHVGIFLVDASGRYAVLKAANSPGGRRMLERGHRLEVGVAGIVGQVARAGRPRIALDVGEDPVFFDNPDLPDTRSEMALPLVSRGRTIGVLDVQSQTAGAFTAEDANNLSILADQVAAAIENANLHRTTQEALAEAQTLYSDYLQQGWQDYAENEPGTGYVQELIGGKKLEQPFDSAEVRKAISDGHVVAVNASGKEQPKLVIPIRLRGQVIGVVNIQGNVEGRAWTDDDLEIAQASSERLALALENARLLQDSQRRAAKERAIGEITAKISSNIKTASVVETTIQELQRAVPNAAVSIQLHDDGGADGGARPAPKPGINAPIMLRGEELGIINIRAPQGTTVKPDQMDLIYAVADRAALSLENARLFEETTRRAQRERLVTEITTKIRASNDPQEMIRTAVNELREALGVSRIEVITQSGPAQPKEETDRTGS